MGGGSLGTPKSDHVICARPLLGKGDLHACEQTSLHAGHAVFDHEAVAGGGGGRLEPALG